MKKNRLESFRIALKKALSRESRLATQAILSDDLLQEKLLIKNEGESVEDIAVATREVVRYLSLCCQTERSIFFPGSTLADKVWHIFIIETAFYRNLCEALGARGIVDHSGMEYEDYAKMFSSADLHEEQLSWISSYIVNFGEIEESSCKHLPLVEEMASRYKISIPELNQFALAAEKMNSTSESFNDVIESLSDQVFNLDFHAHDISCAINRIFSASSFNHTKELAISNDQLRKIFGVSLCLGFTVWQNLAALERLKQLPNSNLTKTNIWNDLCKGKLKVGLGLTHLAKYQTILEGHTIGDKYLLNGKVPWASGIDIFDYFLIGFREKSQNVIAWVSSETLLESRQVVIKRQKLEALNGTNSCEIHFDQYEIDSSQIISKTELNNPSKKYRSEYIIPDTGFIHQVLKNVEALVTKQSESLKTHFREAIERIQNQTLQLERASVQNSAENLNFYAKKDELAQSAVHLLNLAEGGSALRSGSMSALFSKQILLLNAVVQPDDLKIKKIKSLAI